MPANKGRKAKANTRSGNGKGRKSRKGRKGRRKVDPVERKARNRTILLFGLLMAVNAYVFLWRGEGSIGDLSVHRAAAIGGHEGPLGTYAAPPDDACTSESLRIFDGLENLIRAETNLEGRDLRTALAGLGVGEASISAAINAIRPVFDLDLLAESHTPLRIVSDRFGDLQAAELGLEEGHVVQICRGHDGYEVRTLQHAPSSDVAMIELELGRAAELLRAVKDAGEAPELAAMIAAALAYDVDFLTDARPHDRIKVAVEKRFLGGEFHRFGSLLGIRFVGEAGTFTYLRHRPESGEAALYTRNGQPRQRQLLRTPFAFHRVAPEARGLLAPTLEVIGGRTGAMFRRPEGAPVVALGDATVRSATEAGDAGLVLELQLEDGLNLRYAHLSRVVGNLRPGTPVHAGQVIALAGHSGKTASDRVRLEMWNASVGQESMLDPLFIQSRGEGRPKRQGDALEGDELDRFYEDTIALRRLLR